MHRKYNKFLIVSFVGVIILGAYSYLHNDLQSSEASSTSLTSSLDTSGTASATGSTSSTAGDVAFISQLDSLNIIKIDASLFSDKSFNLLVDNSIKLDPVPYGRTNPFSPIGIGQNTTNNKTTALLKTDQASLVTTNGATLNGSLEGATSSNVYFEYGTTGTLGKVTSKVAPSLIGNFTTVVTGLAPSTTYYFHLAANINGTIIFGDIVSFKTN